MDETPAKHGEKMIVIELRFFTEGLTEAKGLIRPKHASVCGTITLRANKSHGIKSGKSFPFNSLMEIPKTLEDILISRGIVLHMSDSNSHMKKYLT